MFKRTAFTVVMAFGLVAQAQAQLSGPLVPASGRAASSAEPPLVAPATAPLLIIEPESVRDHSPDRFWGSIDYLFGFIKSTGVPPLVSTSPPGTAQSAAGVLTQPNTTFLFGNQNTGGNLRSGFRIGAA